MPASTRHPSADSAPSRPELGQVDPWLRLVVVMAAPVLLLLLGMSLTR